jgi:hypothetical protein
MKIKKAHIVLISFFLLFNQSNAEAQVTIGANRKPHPGAILELESQSNHGLLLPHILLNDADTWQLDGTPVEGMVVYNEASSVSNNLKGKGFYVWIGNKWRIAQQVSCEGTPSIGTISVSRTNASVNEIFQAWVDPSAEATQYIWAVTGTATVVGYSNTNVISLAGTKAGNANIRVIAVNACGTTAISEPKNVTIN